MVEYSIQVRNLTKTIGNNTILDQINLTLIPGKIYGLVGRNGSGKTMLLRCICGFIHPTLGSITIAGKMLSESLRLEPPGILIESPGFLDHYSGFRNLKILADIRNIIDADQIKYTLKKVGLDPDSNKKLSQYSMGMRQRLGIAQAIMENPHILLLDEPMNGLDNEGVADIRNLLLSLKEEGKLILLASHSKEDITLLCDDVFEIDHGVVTNHSHSSMS